MSDHRHAWAAGFLDGEGCFTLLRKGSNCHPTTRTPSISVSQVAVEPLCELRDLYGGYVRKQTDRIWSWHLNRAQEVASAIDELMPFLILKREVAEVVRDYSLTVNGSRTNPRFNADVIAIRSVIIQRHEAAMLKMNMTREAIDIEQWAKNMEEEERVAG